MTDLLYQTDSYLRMADATATAYGEGNTVTLDRAGVCVFVSNMPFPFLAQCVIAIVRRDGALFPNTLLSWDGRWYLDYGEERPILPTAGDRGTAPA